MQYLIAASVVYVLGGMAMAKSNGFAEWIPSLLVFIFFGVGAALQTYGMKAQSLGVAYVLVLGLEAVLACAVGLIFLKEPFNWIKILGTALVVIGIVLLKAQERV
jgi:multidrug transporter EmrE-like cation transporter